MTAQVVECGHGERTTHRAKSSQPARRIGVKRPSDCSTSADLSPLQAGRYTVLVRDGIRSRISRLWHRSYWRIVRLGSLWMGLASANRQPVCPSSRNPQQELAGLPRHYHSTSLSTAKNLPRKSQEGRRRRKILERSNRTHERATDFAGRIDMAVTILNKGHYLPASFTVPQSKNVLIDMEASQEIDLFVLLNSEELNAFKAGARPSHRAAFKTRKFYGKINLADLGAPVELPQSSFLGQLAIQPRHPTSLLGAILASSVPLPGSTWYLVIANREPNNEIAVFYRVYDA